MGVMTPVRICSLLISVALAPQVLPAVPAMLSLPGQNAAPGSSIVLPLAFDPSGEGISGVQFDVQFDNTAMSLVAVPGDSARNSGKQIYEADQAPNVKRFLIIGLNTNLMSSGALLNFFVNLNPNAASGVYSLHFSNVVATDPYGGAAGLVSADGAVTVAGTIAQSVPLEMSGVLNGASLVSGPLAPGEIVTLIGSGIGSGGAQVLFDGNAASLLYVGSNQINGVTPYEVAGQAVTNLKITSGGQAIASLTMPVAAASPGVFTLDGSGAGPGAILNQDSSVNSASNPAGRGTVVTLYATGAGQTNPPGVDGQVTGTVLSVPILGVSVQIGGLETEILYSGAAPGLISGVLQVNCRIPANVTAGYSVPVALIVGTAASTGSATVAVN